MFKKFYERTNYLKGMSWESFGVKTDWIMVVASLVIVFGFGVAIWIGRGLLN